MSQMTTIRRKATPLLKVICYWCHKIVGYKPCPPIQDGHETSACCRTCTPAKYPWLEITPDMVAAWDEHDRSLKEYGGGL